MDFEIVFGIVEVLKLCPKRAFFHSTLLTSLMSRRSRHDIYDH
jgi:hypothetical protein